MTKIGPYQILEVLHSGPRPLYKVKAADGRVLALKSIALEGLSDEMRERFMREANICRALDHPNLVRVYDAGEADGVLYQAMDLLTGSDLNAALCSGRQFTWPDKLSMMEQVCDGLQFAHERKMVHRDIKPANIFLEDSGRVRLLDFGMARVSASELTKAGSTLGTLNYMSPEQIRGTRCTAASDVFSAGIVFFQVATGNHPFSSRDRSLAQVVSAIVFEAPPKLSEICPDAPEGLEFLLNKAMEKAPEARFQSAGELRQAIALCGMTLDLAAAGPAPAVSPPTDAPKAPPPATAEGEKTQVLQKMTAPSEEQKTVAFRREDIATRVLTKAPSGVKPPVGVRPPPPSGVKPPSAVTPPASGVAPPKFRYCPSCTFANPLTAPVCGGCGLPLGQAPAEKPAAGTPWALYLSISIAVLLAIALVVVLIVKH
jgi:serine/threonine protein kinase